MSDKKISFTSSQDFEALAAARNWCSENGYSYGELQADAPTGLLEGDFKIAKWRNLSQAQRKHLDGFMEAPGRTYRTGPVHVTVFAK